MMGVSFCYSGVFWDDEKLFSDILMEDWPSVWEGCSIYWARFKVS